MFRKIVFAVTVVIFTCSLASAAPVRVPSNVFRADSVIDEMDGKLLMGVGAEYDHVDKIKFKESQQANYDSASGLISLTYDKKYSVYGTFGDMLGFEFSDTDGDKANFDDSFMWGAGANGVILEHEGYQLFADGSYTATVDMDVNKLTVDSMVFTKADFIPGASATGKLEEWQVALGVAKDFEWIKPYAGAIYLDSKVSAEASSGSNSISASVKNKDKVGVFVGVQINPIKGLGINIQGRFIDETAVMGSVTYQF
jgi:hypothetical protein